MSKRFFHAHRAPQANCMVCDIHAYDPSKKDFCLHANFKTRLVHVALMQAGRRMDVSGNPYSTAPTQHGAKAYAHV